MIRTTLIWLGAALLGAALTTGLLYLFYLHLMGLQ